MDGMETKCSIVIVHRLNEWIQTYWINRVLIKKKRRRRRRRSNNILSSFCYLSMSRIIKTIKCSFIRLMVYLILPPDKYTFNVDLNLRFSLFLSLSLALLCRPLFLWVCVFVWFLFFSFYYSKPQQYWWNIYSIQKMWPSKK